MYQPNRVGPHPIKDLDIDNAVWDPAWSPSLASSVHDYGTKFVQLEDAFIPELYSESTWSCPSSSTLPSSSAHSWGVIVSGEPVNNKMPLFSLSANGLCCTQTVTIGFEVFIGRLEGAPSADRTKVNEVKSWLMVATGNRHVSYNGSLVPQDELGDGFGNNAVIAGITVYNFAATDLELAGIQLSIGLHRFTTQLEMLDPKR